MGEIIEFTGETVIDSDPIELLEKAKTWEMTRCVVVGLTDEGEVCFGGSFSDAAQINYILDRAKLFILAGEDV